MGEGQTKATVLVAHADRNEGSRIAALCNRLFTQLVVFQASEGPEAFMKVQNSPPSVLVLSYDLPKLSGRKIVEWAFANPKAKNIAAVFVGPLPEEEAFVDEVVTGQVQFLLSPFDETSFSRCLAKALHLGMPQEARRFSLKFLAEGDSLLKTGEAGRNVYLLKRGRLKAFLEQDSREVVLGHIESGEFVGEMAYINGEPRSANVCAVEASELIEIPTDLVDHILFRKPAWARALMRTLTKRIKILNEKKSQT